MMAASPFAERDQAQNSDEQSEPRKINFNRYVSQMMNPTADQMGSQTSDLKAKNPGQAPSQPTQKVNYQTVLNKLKKQLSHFHSSNTSSNNMTQSIFGKQSDTETMSNYKKNLQRFHGILLDNKWRVPDAKTEDGAAGEAFVNKFWQNLPIEVTEYQDRVRNSAEIQCN